MIQINLLPDVKSVYVKAQRTKRTVITFSVIISLAAIGVVALLAGVAYGTQKITLNNVQDDIDKSVNEIQNVEDLDKILTIQNQLISIGPLHDDKPVVSRIFKYLEQTTPKDVRIDTISINYAENSIEVSGNAPNVEIINKYVDTLKFTEVKYDANDETEEAVENARAFNQVVLTGFSTEQGESTYDISLFFDAELFNSQLPNVQIIVPKIITTRSEIESPNDLFKLNRANQEEE